MEADSGNGAAVAYAAIDYHAYIHLHKSFETEFARFGMIVNIVLYGRHGGPRCMCREVQ